MDDPTCGPIAPVRFQRICEHNRLEKQFLIDAYECLVAIIEHDDLRSGADGEWHSATGYRATKSKAHQEAIATSGKQRC
jgi:hypothetical protein